MAFVEGDEFFDVYVGNSVSVREHEGIVSYVFSCTEDPPSCLGSKSGVNQGDFPGFTVLFMDSHLVVFKIESDVAAVEEVVGEIFFDDVSFVSQKNDKIVVSIPGVDLHDVPENRMGFGMMLVSSARRVPMPPARIRTFIFLFSPIMYYISNSWFLLLFQWR